jgi:predicted 3-demethylubiquinone-9 3-methyltransferase (glyoxalase superfamily)
VRGLSTFLWFDDCAEDAARFYVSVVPGSRVTGVNRYGDAGPGAAGSVLTVEFELDGRPFVALNGGPTYSLTPAFSICLWCESQEEVDHLWAVLGEGGEESMCGWLTDRFGLSWQIVPTVLPTLLAADDPVRAARVTQAMLAMRRLDIAGLQAAYDGDGT